MWTPGKEIREELLLEADSLVNASAPLKALLQVRFDDALHFRYDVAISSMRPSGNLRSGTSLNAITYATAR